MWRGLGMLEGIEKYAIALNLGMIGALLFGLTIYNVNLLIGGDWALPDISSSIDFHDMRVLLVRVFLSPGGRNLGSRQHARAQARAVDLAVEMTLGSGFSVGQRRRKRRKHQRGICAGKTARLAPRAGS